MIDVDAALAFTSFVEARHQVWEARQRGEDQPWTDDPIVASHKFTNVFRLLDPGSQFVLTDLIEPGLPPEDLLLRLFLYRHTGRVEAWQYLDMTCGYPTRDNLQEVWESWKEYRGAGVTKPKPPRRDGQKGRGNGSTSTTYQRPMFTGAYLVFPQSQVPGTDKLESILELTDRLFNLGGVAEDFLAARDQAFRFGVLRRNKGVADFMSMQILTDFGYSTEFRENDFVVPGPGARKGAAALAPGMKAEDVIRWAFDAVLASPGCPLLWHSVAPMSARAPSLMDIQNCLCEFSKYVRYSTKPSPQKPYAPAHPGVQLPPVLPQHW